MKHRDFSAFSVLLATASISAASTVRIQVASPYQIGSGGEFTAIPQTGYVGEAGLPGDLGFSFQTFCIETNEHLFQSDGLYNATLSFGASLGGSGGQEPAGSGYDPLDDRTAFLYEQFRLGTLPGYFDFAGGRQQAAGALQAAIWFLEDEVDFDGVLARPEVNGSADPVRALAESFLQLAGDAVLNGYTNTNVRVMNLEQDGGVRQDLLTLVPLPSAATAGLAGLLASGCWTLTRRRR